MIYLITFLLLLILCYHYDFKNHKGYRKLWIFLCYIIIVCTSGFRYRMGSDSINYEMEYLLMPDLFNYMTFDFDSTRYGRGYLFLNAIARTISPHFYVMQILHAIILNFLLFRFFYKYSNYIFSCIIIYYVCGFLYFNYMILRESLAVGIFLFGWKYLIDKKLFKYYMCSIIAISFHPSAIIITLLPIINLKYINKLFSFNKLFILSCFIVFIFGYIISLKFFEYIRLLEVTDLDNYANTYEKEFAGGGLLTRNFKFFLLLFIENLLYPLVVLYLIKHKSYIFYKDRTPLINIKIYESVICFSIYILIINLFIPIFSRFNNYFSPFIWLGVADIFIGYIKTFKLNYINRFILSLIFIIPLLTINIRAKFFSTSGHSSIPGRIQYLPYVSIFDPVLIEKREQFYGDIKYR